MPEHDSRLDSDLKAFFAITTTLRTSPRIEDMTMESLSRRRSVKALFATGLATGLALAVAVTVVATHPTTTAPPPAPAHTPLRTPAPVVTSPSPSTSPAPTATVTPTVVQLQGRVVHVTYSSTDPPGAQNSQDGSPVLANGSYLERNGAGVVTYNQQVVAKDTRIRDAVLSKNGRHWAYRIELAASADSLPTRSQLVIDGRNAGILGSEALDAIGDNGTSYLTTVYTGKLTPTAYNTGIGEEIIRRNGSEVVRSPYGFLSVESSGDLSTVLAVSRNAGAGQTVYRNEVPQKACSSVSNANLESGATLSPTGGHLLCWVYDLSGAEAPYAISNLRVAVDGSVRFTQSGSIHDDTVRFGAIADSGSWAVGGASDLASAWAITQDGKVVSLNTLVPALAKLSQQPACATAQIGWTQFAMHGSGQYAVAVPCSSTTRVLVTGLPLAGSMDVGSASVIGLEFDPAGQALFVYTR